MMESSTSSNATTNSPVRRKLRTKKTAKQHDRHFVQHDYHDHANERDTDQEHVPVQRQRGGVTLPFPIRLHSVLSKAEEEGFQDIISWQPHGRCFVIHKPKQFVTEVMPLYFNQTKLTSFQRQLNLYGFVRLTRGMDTNGYYHEYFLRGRPFLTKHMVRTRVKGTKIKGASSPDKEPDFYALPPVSPYSYTAATTTLTENQEEERIISDDSSYAASLESYPADLRPLAAPSSLFTLQGGSAMYRSASQPTAVSTPPPPSASLLSDDSTDSYGTSTSDHVATVFPTTKPLSTLTNAVHFSSDAMTQEMDPVDEMLMEMQREQPLGDDDFLLSLGFTSEEVNQHHHPRHSSGNFHVDDDHALGRRLDAIMNETPRW